MLLIRGQSRLLHLQKEISTGWIRTNNLRVMSPTRYLYATVLLRKNAEHIEEKKIKSNNRSSSHQDGPSMLQDPLHHPAQAAPSIPASFAPLK
jgi:hypothetical protein